MKNGFIRTDSFLVKKHKLRIFRVAERGTGIILWTTEQQAAQYVQKLHIQKLMTKGKGYS